MIHKSLNVQDTMILAKTTAAQNEASLSYHKVRGLFFLAIVFAATINKIYFQTKNHGLGA